VDSCSLRSPSRLVSHLRKQSREVHATSHNCEFGSDSTCEVYGPTVIQLLARPELYDGKRIQTIGFLHLEFEGNELVPSAEFAEHVFGSGIGSRCLIPSRGSSPRSTIST
jgi:hypothetical protein